MEAHVLSFRNRHPYDCINKTIVIVMEQNTLSHFSFEHILQWTVTMLDRSTIVSDSIKVIRIHQRINDISFVRDGCLCWGAQCPFFLLTDAYSIMQLQWRRLQWNAEAHFLSFPIRHPYNCIDKTIEIVMEQNKLSHFSFDHILRWIITMLDRSTIVLDSIEVIRI